MKLAPGERSILAAFQTTDAAQSVKPQLEQLGFTVQIDRTSQFGETPPNRDLNNPVANEAVTLTGLTLYSGDDEETAGNTGPLLAVHPAASGLSGPPVSSHNFLLTAVGPSGAVERALTLIRGAGGRV